MFSLHSLQRLLTVLTIAILWSLSTTANAGGADTKHISGNNKGFHMRHIHNKSFIPISDLIHERHKVVLSGHKSNKTASNKKQIIKNTFADGTRRSSRKQGENVKKNNIPNMVDIPNLEPKNLTVIVNDDPQKRTKLREKELTFYGDLLNPTHTQLTRSNLKDDKDKYSSIQVKSFYGSKDNPAKSCRDIFLTDRRAKSGNYYIRTSDDELLMVTCGFPDVNETLVTEDEKSNTTKDGEYYYQNEKVAPSAKPSLKSEDDMETASTRDKDLKQELTKKDSNNKDSNEKDLEEQSKDDSNIKDLKHELNKTDSKDHSNSKSSKEESNMKDSKVDPSKKYSNDSNTSNSNENLNKKDLKEASNKADLNEHSSNKNNLTEISNDNDSKNDSNEEALTPNPTGIPINFVLPNKTSQIVMKAEFADEIKDLTKPLNSIVKRPDGVVNKENYRNESNSDGNKEKEKDGKKDDKSEKSKGKETFKQSKESNQKDKDKEDGKTTKEPPPKNPEPKYEPTTTTAPIPYNTLIPKMSKQTTEAPPTTKPLHYEDTTPTTKPLEKQPTTAASQTTKYVPTPTPPKPPTTAPLRYTDPKLSPNPQLAGQIGREQYKNFEKNTQNPSSPSGAIEFPPANGYQSESRPAIPLDSRPYPIPQQRPNMVGYGFNGPPPDDRRPYYPPPPRGNYGPPMNSRYSPRPLVRPPYPGQVKEDMNEFERKHLSSPYIKETKSMKLGEGDGDLESSKFKVPKGSAATGNAGDLGDIQEEHPPPLPVAHQAPTFDTLYGRRDTRPGEKKQQFIPKKLKEVSPLARSVSWGFHEGVMRNEMTFDHQYKDFEEMDEKIDAKHKKEQEKVNATVKNEKKSDDNKNSDGKSKEYVKSKEVQEKAKTRSWEVNRQEMVKEVAKQQYDDFEKSPQQIKQDLASKTYQQQYDAFENFKSSTSNTNPENSTEVVAANPEAYAPEENTKDTDSTFHKNPKEAKTVNNKAHQDVKENKTATLSTNTTGLENTSINPTENLGTNDTVRPKNSSALMPGNSTGAKPQFTDYYKEYMDKVDSGFETSLSDTLPKFPNVASNNNSSNDQRYFSFPVNNNTNELIKMPIAPQLATNAPLGVSSRNITKTFTNGSVPVNQINSTVAVLSKKTETDILQNVANIITKIINNSKTTDATPKNATKRNENLNPEASLIERPNARSILRFEKLRKSDGANTDKANTKSKINLGGHSLRQISGPPNPIVKEQISLPTLGMIMNTNPERNSDNDNSNNIGATMEVDRSSLVLHNLTGHPELIKTDTKSDIEENSSITKDMLKQLLKSSNVPITELIRKKLINKQDINLDGLTGDGKVFLHNLLKEMEHSTSGKEIGGSNTKDHVDAEVGTKAKADTEGKMQNSNKKFKSMPNVYNFIIPQTRKFAISEKMDEDSVKEKEILGERLISARQKSKLLEQRKRVELIKAQAHSPKEPSMGRFSTADLKQFAYHQHDTFDAFDTPLVTNEEAAAAARTTEKQKTTTKPEAIVLLMPSDVSKITTHLGLEKGNENFKLDSTQHSLFHKDLSMKQGVEKTDEKSHDQIELDVSRLVKENPTDTTIIKEKPATTSFVFQKVATGGNHPTARLLSKTGNVRSQVKEPNENNAVDREQSKHNKTEETTLDSSLQSTKKTLDNASPNKKQQITKDETTSEIHGKMFPIEENSKKRQNITRINDGLFNAGLSMQDLITQAQKEMENIPGLTEENKKVNDKSGTYNETAESIKAEEERIKQQVDKQVKEATEENQRQAQQQVQENQPVKPDHNAPITHNINAEALPGMVDKRSQISQRPKRKKTQANESQVPPFIKESIDIIRKEQEKLKQEILEKAKESATNRMKQQYQNNLKSHQQVQGFVQNKSTGSTLNITLSPKNQQRSKLKKNDKGKSQKKKSHLKKKKVSHKLKQKKKGVTIESKHLGKTRQLHQDIIALTPTKKHEHQHPTKAAGRRLKIKKSTKPMFSDSSLAKPFFEEEGKSFDSTHTQFPEEKNSLQHSHKREYSEVITRKIDGKILGSAARRFRKYELKRIASQHQKENKGVKTVSKRNSYPYEELIKSLRGLIPSAIGKLSPSSDAPLPLVGSDPPTKGQTTQTEVKLTSSEDSTALSNMLNEVIILQRQSQQIGNETNTTTKVSTSGDSEASNVEANGKPHVDSGPQEDTRPESEKQSKRPANDSDDGPGESGKDEVGTSVSSKMAHKLQKTDNDKKIENKTKGNRDKNADKTFEAGLKEAIDHANAEGLKDEVSNVANTDQSDNQRESPKSQMHENGESRESDGKPQTEDEDQKNQQEQQQEGSLQNTVGKTGDSGEETNGNNPQLKIEPQNGASNIHSITQPVNVTALELGIIKLLNQTVRPRATTAHGKKMEELNLKYETLKLPIENGDLLEAEDVNPNDKLPNQKIAEALNRTKSITSGDEQEATPQQHKPSHPILPPPKSPQKDTSLSAQISEIVDATPVESGPTETSQQNPNENQNSGQEQSATATTTTTGKTTATEPSGDESIPDYIPETISIQLPVKVSSGGQEHEKSPQSSEKTNNQHDTSTSQESSDDDHQTPAELAKKITNALNSINTAKTNPTATTSTVSTSKLSSQQESKKEASSSINTNKEPTSSPIETSTTKDNKGVDFTINNFTLPVSTISGGKAGENSIPIIPIPMDSELGKLLYPAMNKIPTKASTANTTADGNGAQVADDTKVDGTDYSSLLIDQTRKLLRKNKLKHKDLLKLLKTSHVINDIQSEYEKKNKIGDGSTIKQQPILRSTLNSKENIENRNSASNTIHITFKKKNGYLLLEPDKKEAYQKKLVPHAVGLYTLQRREQKKSNVYATRTNNNSKQRSHITNKNSSSSDIIDEDS